MQAMLRQGCGARWPPWKAKNQRRFGGHGRPRCKAPRETHWRTQQRAATLNCNAIPAAALLGMRRRGCGAKWPPWQAMDARRFGGPGRPRLWKRQGRRIGKCSGQMQCQLQRHSRAAVLGWRRKDATLRGAVGRPRLEQEEAICGEHAEDAAARRLVVVMPPGSGIKAAAALGMRRRGRRARWMRRQA